MQSLQKLIFRADKDEIFTKREENQQEISLKRVEKRWFGKNNFMK